MQSGIDNSAQALFGSSTSTMRHVSRSSNCCHLGRCHKASLGKGAHRRRRESTVLMSLRISHIAAVTWAGTARRAWVRSGSWWCGARWTP